jgi:hypothetical protein
MNAFAIIFALVSAVALFLLPRRWAPLPLIAGACFMTLGQGIEIGPFSFTVIRLLIAVGVLRVLLRAERLVKGLNGLDWTIVLWSLSALVSCVFHTDQVGALISRLGLVYNCAGIYFLLRIFCVSVDDLVSLCRATAFLLAFVAAEMIYEHRADYNLFSVFGGVSAVPEFRAGKIRASGPFAHSILAGTVGAVTLPLMVGMWRYYRTTSLLGILVCLSIIVSSSSSGPIMSSLFGIAALLLWPYRRQGKRFRWGAITVYLLLLLFMNAPPYYLLARIDIVGGSTGWYRARLIESAFEHLDEWWLGGTDVTRHWMPTLSVNWKENKADITNHYLSMGVTGGLPLMLCFIASISKGFAFVGREMREEVDLPPRHRFMVWALGSSLFAHSATCISVSYFDQSFVFLYLTLAAIGSAREASELPSTHLSIERTTDTLRPVRAVRGYPTQTRTKWARITETGANERNSFHIKRRNCEKQ